MIQCLEYSLQTRILKVGGKFHYSTIKSITRGYRPNSHNYSDKQQHSSNKSSNNSSCIMNSFKIGMPEKVFQLKEFKISFVAIISPLYNTVELKIINLNNCIVQCFTYFGLLLQNLMRSCTITAQDVSAHTYDTVSAR